MARASLSSRDPARDAAALLRRLGLAVLTLGVPTMSLISRRGLVLLLPIGAALLVVAASLDWGARPFADSLDRLTSSPGAVALGFGIVWMGVSLAWSHDPAASAARLGGLLGTLGLALAVYLSLPDRTRAANIYLVPIGVGLAAAVAIALSLTTRPVSDFDEDGRSLGRGLSVLALFLWPSVAWLRSRDRGLEAACLTVLVAVAAVLGPGAAPSIALAIGLFVFGATSLSRPLGLVVTGALVIGGLALVPMLAILPPPSASPAAVAWRQDLDGWGAIVRSDPWRLLTGHGFGALFRARLAGTVPANAPGAPLIQIWYELGLVGALTVGIAVWAALGSASSGYRRLAPGLTGAFAAAYTLGCLGIGAGQAWWPGALAILGLIFVCAERGQYRTRRPRARDIATRAAA